MVSFHVWLLLTLQESAVHCYGHCVHASILHGAFFQSLSPSGMWPVQLRHMALTIMHNNYYVTSIMG